MGSNLNFVAGLEEIPSGGPAGEYVDLVAAPRSGEYFEFIAAGAAFRNNGRAGDHHGLVATFRSTERN